MTSPRKVLSNKLSVNIPQDLDSNQDKNRNDRELICDLPEIQKTNLNRTRSEPANRKNRKLAKNFKSLPNLDQSKKNVPHDFDVTSPNTTDTPLTTSSENALPSEEIGRAHV